MLSRAVHQVRTLLVVHEQTTSDGQPFSTAYGTEPAIGPNGAAAKTFTSATVPVAPKPYAQIKATHEFLAEGHTH